MKYYTDKIVRWEQKIRNQEPLKVYNMWLRPGRK